MPYICNFIAELQAFSKKIPFAKTSYSSLQMAFEFDSQKLLTESSALHDWEVPSGFEPLYEVLQTSA